MVKTNKSVLEQYKELVKNNKSEKSGIQPVLFQDIDIPKGHNFINVKVFDTLNIGSDSKNTCNINTSFNFIIFSTLLQREFRLKYL